MKYTDELLISSRIESAKQSITRARNVVLLAVLVSMTLFIAEFNGYFSWYRFFVLIPKMNDMTRTASDFPKDVRESYLKVAQEQLVKSWVESRMVTIAPLGIRFGIGDISVVGPPALFIIAIVSWYCSRRENHTIVRILRDTKNKISGNAEDDIKVRATIYHSIASHLVFMPVNEVSKPLDGLEEAGDTRQSRLIRAGFRFLLYFPLAAAFVIAAIEIYTNEVEEHLSLRVFRDNLANQSALDNQYKQNAQLKTLIEHVESANIFQRRTYDIVPVIFTICLAIVLTRIEKYQNSTTRTLREYANLAKVYPPPSPLPIPKPRLRRASTAKAGGTS